MLSREWFQINLFPDMVSDACRRGHHYRYSGKVDQCKLCRLSYLTKKAYIKASITHLTVSVGCSCEGGAAGPGATCPSGSAGLQALACGRTWSTGPPATPSSTAPVLVSAAAWHVAPPDNCIVSTCWSIGNTAIQPTDSSLPRVLRAARALKHVTHDQLCGCQPLSRGSGQGCACCQRHTLWAGGPGAELWQGHSWRADDAGDSSSRGDDYEVLHVSGTSGMRSPPDLSGQGQPYVQRSTRGRPVRTEVQV